MRVLNNEESVYAKIFGETTLQDILDNPVTKLKLRR